MKKLIIFAVIAFASLTTFAQKDYSDFDTVADVLIRTKIRNASNNDPNSPLELSLYFQNVGTTDVIVRYEIFIEDDNGDKRHTGKKEVKLRKGQKQAGKISNLAYELFGTNKEDYESGERKWYFTLLEVKDMTTGEVIATSNKVKELDD